MPRTDRVQSSVLRAITYDDDTRTLEVHFHSGRVYDYFDVPLETYEALLTAPSIGTYFNQMIKPQFQCERRVEKAGRGG